MDVLITAGGKPGPKDPLYAQTQGGYKALLDVAGKSMIQWLLDALSASELVGRVVIVGLPVFTDLECNKPVSILADAGTLFDNARSGLAELTRMDPTPRAVLATSSDIPCVTTEMVDWMIRTVQASDDQVYYNVIPREVMEAAYPGSNRTYIRLKDVEVCGGDMNALHTSLADSQDPLWDRILEARKNPLKQASLLGYDTLFFLMLHRISLAEAARTVSGRLGIHGKAILCPYAQVGMDVDKPHQLEMARAELAKRQPV